MNKITVTDETLGKQFRSALNSFLHSNFIIAGDLDSLETAIEIEAMILAKGFIIQYEVDKGTRRIRRAKNIFRSNGRNKQRLTIKDVYGKRLLKLKKQPEVETISLEIDQSEEVVDGSKFVGKYVYNINTSSVGIIKRYVKGNATNPKGDPIEIKMRFRVTDVFMDKDHVLKLRNNNTWNESSCMVFDDPIKLVTYVIEEKSKLYTDQIYLTQVMDNLDKRLSILKEKLNDGSINISV